MSKTKLVYIHRNPNNNEVFYVGMGNKERPYSKERSVFWKRYVKKHGNPVVEIIDSGLSKKEAIESELALIELIGRRDKSLGTLVNLTDGGEGFSGFIKKGFCVYDIETGQLFEKITDASKSLNIPNSTITDQLNKGRLISKENTLRKLNDPYPVHTVFWKKVRKNEMLIDYDTSIPYEEYNGDIDFNKNKQKLLLVIPLLPKKTISILISLYDRGYRETCYDFKISKSKLHRSVSIFRKIITKGFCNIKYKGDEFFPKECLDEIKYSLEAL